MICFAHFNTVSAWHTPPPFSLLVGAELLSILDETENGFIWEHIQSYAEQAHGAWLGISVKGWETLTGSLSLQQRTHSPLFFLFFLIQDNKSNAAFAQWYDFVLLTDEF